MRAQTKKTLITAAIVLGVLLAVVATILIIRAASSPTPSPETSQDTTPTPNTEPAKDDTSAKPEDSETDDAASTTPVFDPATTATIAITPLDLTVYYTKGVGALSFQVLRTPTGTRYVEFQADDLIGTKCTNDQGSFASILEKPTSTEEATLSNKVTLEGATYGLSLADDSCTTDPALLKAYQSAFADKFTLLSHIE